MKEIIEAFEIFNKYIPDEKYPTNCSHDQLYVNCNPDLVTDEDIEKLDELGFIIGSELEDGFISFKFGSC